MRRNKYEARLKAGGTLRSGSTLDHLNVDPGVSTCVEDLVQAASPDVLLADDGEEDHGFVALAVVPYNEDKKGGAETHATHEQPEDLGAVPGATWPPRVRIWRSR